MIGLAHVYERQDVWYYQPSSLATTGLWFATPPLLTLSRHAPLREKGQTAVKTLKASQNGLPLPADTSAVVAPLLAEAGTPSWSAFVRTAKCVGLEMESGRLTIIPHRQIPRSKGSLEGIEGQEIVLSADAAVETIGTSLEEAFARCE
jgi:hypothetical protein